MARTEAPNPKSADYQLKDGLINQLGNGDPAVATTSLYDLGVALAADPLLSGKQREKLLSGLVDGGLLTYQTNYFAELDRAEEENRLEAAEEVLEASLDIVQWELESNGRLQARTIVSAALLSQEKPSLAQKIAIISDLLNAAHLATKKASHFEKPYDDERYQRSFTQLETIEGAVFAQRTPYASELVELDLATPEETENLGELDIDAFRELRNNTELYDHLIALYFVRKFSATDTTGRFKELQEIIYIGYTMGARDANEAYTRYWGEENSS